VKKVAAVVLLLSISAAAQCGWRFGTAKEEHMIGGAAISITFASMAQAFGKHQWKEKLGLLTGFLAGVAKEGHDAATEKETTCSHVADLGVTTAGAAVPWLAAKIVKHYAHKDTATPAGK
jgi:hypothetical protein